LDIEELMDKKYFDEYIRRVSNYVVIQKQSVENFEHHWLYLYTGCVGIIGELSKFLFKDDWFIKK